MLRLGRMRRQAALLDRYCALLHRDRAAIPPPDLDPDLALVAHAVERENELPAAPATLRADLWKRIEAQGSPSREPRIWGGPAVNPNNYRASTAETEEQDSMPASTSQPVSLQQRRWGKELWKVAAAIAIFAIVGAVLVLLLRDNDDEPAVGAPGTSTTLASPAADATGTVEGTPTRDVNATQEAARAKLTATAGAVVATEAAEEAEFATAQAALDPPGEIVATIEVGTEPGALAATDDAIWVGNGQDGTVSRIDPSTNTVVATITTGSPGAFGPNASPSDIDAYDGQVWVLHNSDGAIVRIDPATNTVAQTIALEPVTRQNEAASIAVDESGIWVSDFLGDQLLHIDPETGALLASIDIPEPNEIASGFGSIWVMAGPDYGPYRIVRVDPASHQIMTEIPVEVAEGIAVATGAGAVWVADWGSTRIARIDPETNTVVATLDNPLHTSHSVVATENGVWVTSIFADGVVRIDPATNQPSRYIDTDNGGSVDTIEAAGSIWVSHGSENLVVRIDPAP